MGSVGRVRHAVALRLASHFQRRCGPDGFQDTQRSSQQHRRLCFHIPGELVRRLMVRHSLDGGCLGTRGIHSRCGGSVASCVARGRAAPIEAWSKVRRQACFNPCRGLSKISDSLVRKHEMGVFATGNGTHKLRPVVSPNENIFCVTKQK